MLVVNNPSASAGEAREAGSVPGLGRSPGEGKGNPLQYFSLENSINRGAWQVTVSPWGLQRVKHDWATNTFIFIPKLHQYLIFIKLWSTNLRIHWRLLPEATIFLMLPNEKSISPSLLLHIFDDIQLLKRTFFSHSFIYFCLPIVFNDL